MNRPGLALLALVSTPSFASVPLMLARAAAEVDPNEAAGEAVGKVVAFAVFGYLLIRALRPRS